MAIFYRCGGGGSDDITYLAEDYETTKSYVVGDIVAYEGTVYKCKTATTGTWDSSKWEQMYFVELPDLDVDNDFDGIDYIAPDYDSTQTYNTDDTVLYAGELYKCTDDNVTGAFDNSKWERVNLVEVGDLNSNLGGKKIGSFSWGGTRTENTVSGKWGRQGGASLTDYDGNVTVNSSTNGGYTLKNNYIEVTVPPNVTNDFTVKALQTDLTIHAYKQCHYIDSGNVTTTDYTVTKGNSVAISDIMTGQYAMVLSFTYEEA